MRILNLVHQYLPEFVGGTELYTQSIAQAAVAAGHQVGIFFRSYADRPAASALPAEAITLYPAAAGPLVPSRRFLAVFGQAGLHQAWIQALDAFQPDLVHVQHLMGLPASLLTVLAQRRIPYLVTLLDYWWVCANANLLTNFDDRSCAGPRGYLNCTHCAVARAGGRAAWLAAPALPAVLARRNQLLRGRLAGAWALLAPSRFVAQWYADHSVPAAHLRTLPWGVTLPDGGLPPRTPRDQALRLLYLGGLAPNKGVHVVLEALAGVHGAVEFTIAGDETAHPDYSRRLHDLADSRVRFAGRLDRTQVWTALRAADVVVVPSVWHETFCLVAHEALAAGTPVLASRMGALTEAVEEGRSGFLLPPGDVPAWQAAIQRLVDDRTLAAALGAQIETPLLFADHARAVLAAYAEAVSGAPAAAQRLETPFA